MIRTKGEAGTGNVVEAVRHMRTMNREIRQLAQMPVEEVTGFAQNKRHSIRTGPKSQRARTPAGG